MTLEKELLLNFMPNPAGNYKLLLEKYHNVFYSIIILGAKILKEDCELPRKGQNNVTPTLLFRNIVECMDAISILYSTSAIEPAKAVTRSMLELSWQLEYMLKGSGKTREYFYMVFKMVRDLNEFKLIKSDQTALDNLISQFDNSIQNIPKLQAFILAKVNESINK